MAVWANKAKDCNRVEGNRKCQLHYSVKMMQICNKWPKLPKQASVFDTLKKNVRRSKFKVL